MTGLLLSSGDTRGTFVSLVWLSVACLSLPHTHLKFSLCLNFLGVIAFVVVFNTTCQGHDKDCMVVVDE